MGVVVFIYGDPNNGKTTLAKQLNRFHGLEVLHLDGEYVEFIRTKIPNLYFESLKHYIAPQYETILRAKNQSRTKYGRDFEQEWFDHLSARLVDLSARHVRLVVEGWHLKYFKQWFRENLPPGVHVRAIEVKRPTVRGDRVYTLKGVPVTLPEIAALGPGPTPQG